MSTSSPLVFTQEEDLKTQTIHFNCIQYDDKGNEKERVTWLTYDFKKKTITLSADKILCETKEMNVIELKKK